MGFFTHIVSFFYDVVAIILTPFGMFGGEINTLIITCLLFIVIIGLKRGVFK